MATRNAIAVSAVAFAVALSLSSCKQNEPAPTATQAAKAAPAEENLSYSQKHLKDYVKVPLKADLSGFSDNDRMMIALLVQASQVMDNIYWEQNNSFERELFLKEIKDPAQRELVELNYGPWDRLNDDQVFVERMGPRPPGVGFYPNDMSKEEFEKAKLPDKDGWYSVIRRDEADKLVAVPFHVMYAADLVKAANLLRRAAPLSSDKAFGEYLKMRADALMSDDFRASDMAWMDMKTNPVDIVIGPIETYEDQLFGYKAAYEGMVLIKDQAWSQKLSHYAGYLPELQRALPVPDKYKAEKPGSAADLNAYTAILYAGNANVGAKTIAINLPNDEVVQLAKGSRRLQLENVIQAKFDHILMPIAKELI